MNAHRKTKKKHPINRSVIASHSVKFVLVITLILAVWKQAWLWVIGSVIGLVIESLPYLVKRDVDIALPWSIELLIAAVIGFNMCGVLLSAYYSIPYFSDVTHFLAAILFAFLAFAVIYIVDEHWDGLNMDKYAMAFVVVVTTMAAGVILEFIRYFNLFGRKQYTVEGVLLGLFTTMIAGILMALVGVNLIKKGKFDRMTDELSESFDENVIEKMKKRKKE